MSMPNAPFSFEMLGSELDRFLSGLSAHASEYLSSVTASAGEVSTTLKNVVPRMAGDFPVDLTENETSFIITCEIPGVKKENLSVKLMNPTSVLIKTVEEDTVDLQGGAESQTIEGTYHLHERRNDARQRTIILPSRVKPMGATATFVNGIMELVLPKESHDEDGIEIKIE